MTSRADCERLDAADPLAAFRDRFQLPEGVIYLDGNSLGAMPRGVSERLQQVTSEEWARGLITSWNRAGWVEAATRVGDRIAPLVGAHPGEVVVADNTSVNLYKVLAAALALQGGGDLVTDEGNFPTDLYIAEACARRFGSGSVLRRPRARLLENLPPGSVLTATQVDYRTGHLIDLERVTAAAHEAGALVVWDLCHSAGALPIALSRAGADFAVGCTYKFLNGGPGAPAFVYVAARHAAATPIPGWFGHASTFDFGPDYAPAPGAAGFQTGTPGILGLAALEVAIELWSEVDLEEVRSKSAALGDLVIERVDARCAELGVEVGTPRPAAERGSQVSLLHDDAYAVVQALAERGVVTDCRPPNVVRLGLTPLYTRYVDAWDAIEALRDVLAAGAHRDPRFGARATVP